MQGLAPYLQAELADSRLYDALPDSLRGWLDSQASMNAARARRMHDELQAILQAADRAGLQVMPLKGALLSLCYYPSPGLRPMADLDLLVRPHAGPALSQVLERLGYRPLPPDNPQAADRHLRFIRPEAARVVSFDGEHPDNPRPVEIHTRLRRALWGDVVIRDLSEALWEGGRQAELLGARAWVPDPGSFLVHLATHALEHLMVQTGRVLQWLDLAQVFPSAGVPSNPISSDWIYPPLAIAARAFPDRFRGADLSPLAEGVHPKLRSWAESVPLDGRCGLNVDPAPPKSRGWRVHWERWRPSPWRLALGYGRLPTAFAMGLHLLVMLRHLARRELRPFAKAAIRSA